MKLFMIKIGATLPGRLIEQHDVFFGIAEKVQDLVPKFEAAWPQAADNWHIDCWREISVVDDYRIEVVDKDAPDAATQPILPQLFFLNLGGYRAGVFEEFHHKILVVATSTQDAIAQAKSTAFYQEFGFPGAVSHIDDKYGVAIDETYRIHDVLPDEDKQQYTLNIRAAQNPLPDTLHIGYTSRKKFLEKTA